jgi:F-type H+-transporting ATPase subunit b
MNLPETGSPLDALGINVVGLVAQIINFSLLMLLLYAVLYKPVIRVLDQRSERIRESMRQADEVKTLLERTKQDHAEAMARARSEAQAVIAQALAEGERVRRASIDDAKREADILLERAHAQIVRDTEEASRSLRAEVADLALTAAGRVVGRSFDEAAHFRLIDDVLRDLEQLDPKEVR